MKFYVIGITDKPHPFFPPEVLEVIQSGHTFSGGKRHHEIVQEYLPEGAEWIDITVPLEKVFEQYKLSTVNYQLSSSLPLVTLSSSALPIPSNVYYLMQRSRSSPPSTPCKCWRIGCQ